MADELPGRLVTLAPEQPSERVRFRCLGTLRCELTLRGALLLALFVATGLAPRPVDAQIFGAGARTEFVSGFGIRTFVSFRVFDDLLADGREIVDERNRRANVVVAPLSLIYGLGVFSK